MALHRSRCLLRSKGSNLTFGSGATDALGTPQNEFAGHAAVEDFLAFQLDKDSLVRWQCIRLFVSANNLDGYPLCSALSELILGHDNQSEITFLRWRAEQDAIGE